MVKKINASVCCLQEHLPEHLRTARATAASKRKRKTVAVVAGAAAKKDQAKPQPSLEMDKLTTAIAVQGESAESQPPLPRTPRQRSSKGRKRAQQESPTEPCSSSSGGRDGGPHEKSTAGSSAAVDHRAPHSDRSKRDHSSSGFLPASPSPTISGRDSSVAAAREAAGKAALEKVRASRQVATVDAEVDAKQTSLPPEGVDGAPVTPQPVVRQRKKRAPKLATKRQPIDNRANRLG